MFSCKRCNESKDSSLFYKNSRAKSGFNSWCKTCVNAYQSAARVGRSRPCDHPDNRRAHNLRHLYGMTPESWDNMFAQQGRACGICKEPLTVRAAQTDHCHSTGKVRGILCRHCNTALGHFRECPARLRKAAEFVEAHQ